MKRKPPMEYTIWTSVRTGPKPSDVMVARVRGFREVDGRAELLAAARRFKDDPRVHVWMEKTPRILRGKK